MVHQLHIIAICRRQKKAPRRSSLSLKEDAVDFHIKPRACTTFQPHHRRRYPGILRARLMQDGLAWLSGERRDETAEKKSFLRVVSCLAGLCSPCASFSRKNREFGSFRPFLIVLRTAVAAAVSDIHQSGTELQSSERTGEPAQPEGKQG